MKKINSFLNNYFEISKPEDRLYTGGAIID